MCSAFARTARTAVRLAVPLALGIALAVLSAVASPGRAFAQTAQVAVTLTNGGTGTVRVDSSGKTVKQTEVASAKFAVTIPSCTEDQAFQFPLTYTPTQAGTYRPQLQVWASTQGTCDDLTSRSNTGQCWPVTGTRDIPSLGTAVANDTVTVRVQDILSQYQLTTKNFTYTPATATVCSEPRIRSVEGVTLYFIPFTAGGSSLSGTSISQPIPVRTRGSDPPTLQSARGGLNAIFIDYVAPTSGGGTTTVDGGTTTSTASTTDFKAVHVYCTPKRGSEPAEPDSTGIDPADISVCPADPNAFAAFASPADAGAAADAAGAADADASTRDEGAEDDASTAEAGAGLIAVSLRQDTVEEDAAVTLASFECARFPSSIGKGVRIENLKVGYKYQIALATEDAFGNISELSGVKCGVPVLIDDFYSLYSDAGGLAGGGYCSVIGAGLPAGDALPVGIFGVAGIGIAGAIGAARRRKRS